MSEDQAPQLTGQKAEVRFTVSVTRAETGKVDTYEMVGHADLDKLKQITKEENDHGRNT